MAIAYKCRGCGIVRSEPWEGTCPGYGCYASYQRIANADGVEQGPPPRGVITSLNDVSSPSLERLPSCFPGLDKILGTDPATGLSGIAAKAGQAVQIYGGPGSGKCLGRGTPVLYFDGKVGPVEDVKVGDLLMGPDSSPRRVLSTTSGKGPLYKIVPTKGDPWICNEHHVLTLVYSKRKQPVRDIPLSEYLRDGSATKVRWKLFQPPRIDFPERSEPKPVSPYFLGVWLGDGTKALKEKVNGELVLVGVAITKPDAEIEAACRDEARYFDLSVSMITNTSGCPTWRIVGVPGKPNPLLDTMRSLFKTDLRIPPAYLYSSFEDRASLLAGLLDTDGSEAGGYYEIVQKHQGLATDIAFLARSLGLRVVERVKYVNGVPYYRMFLSGDATHLPLRIPRKRPKERKQVKNALRTGFQVEALGDGDFFGFELDGDGRFLLGDFTVTHNSSMLLQACIEWARQRYDVLYVAGEESLQQIKTRADRFCTKVPAKLLILDEQDLDSVLGALDENTPTIAVVDSLQTISVEDYANGSIMAMRIAAREIYRFTQIHGIGLFVVVQVNKEANNFAGPKEVEHVLDTSLEMKMRGDGKREILCTQKNRFGITPARQLFDMTNKGLVEIAEEEPPPVAVLPVPGTKKLSEKLKEKKPALTSVPEEVDPPTEPETPPEDDPPPSRPPRLSTVP